MRFRNKKRRANKFDEEIERVRNREAIFVTPSWRRSPRREEIGRLEIVRRRVPNSRRNVGERVVEAIVNGC